MNERKVAMLLSNAFKPDPRVLKEARSLVGAGYQVQVIAWDRLGDFPATEEVDGVNIRRVQVKSSYSAGSSQLLYLPRFWRQANRLLAAYRPGVIHCHDLDTMPAGYLYARSHGLPLVFDAHECYPDQMRRQTNPVVFRALLALERFMARRATHVITVGELLADRFRDLKANKVTVVGNFQPLERYEGVAATDRDSFQLPRQTLLVAYIGGFTRERQLLPLIEASSLADGVTVFLAGDGPQRAELEIAAGEHADAKYVGWLPPAQLPAVTKMVDVVYYGLKSDEGNSRYSMPNSLFNAMAAGKPLLTTSFGEVARVVSEEQCGLIVSDANPQALATALKRLKDEGSRAAMAGRSADAAKRRYNWAAAEKALLGVYESLA